LTTFSPSDFKILLFSLNLIIYWLILLLNWVKRLCNWKWRLTRERHNNFWRFKSHISWWVSVWFVRVSRVLKILRLVFLDVCWKEIEILVINNEVSIVLVACIYHFPIRVRRILTLLIRLVRLNVCCHAPIAISLVLLELLDNLRSFGHHLNLFAIWEILVWFWQKCYRGILSSSLLLIFIFSIWVVF
jgi:hypothetical protein